MTKKMKAEWRLRELMEAHCIHSASEMVPRLAERGIQMSRIQVYRLMVQEPSRITLDVLAALCDILECTPNDLIRVKVVNQKMRKAVGESSPALGDKIKPMHVTIRRPK